MAKEQLIELNRRLTAWRYDCVQAQGYTSGTRIRNVRASKRQLETQIWIAIDDIEALVKERLSSGQEETKTRIG